MSAEEDRGGEGEDGPGSYVRRVTQGTLRYAEELTAENHRLRMEVAALCTEKAGLVSGLQRAHDESERHAALYREMESQNTSLANLYVASYRLHGTLDRSEVLATIQEIVTNLVGCEEIAILETNDTGEALTLAVSTGIDPGPFQSVPLTSGLIGWCARTAETFVSGDGDEPPARNANEADLSACVPLKLDGRVSGAIALFRLLPQKACIEAVDRELFDLLATHAATALHCARLHAQQAAVAS
jgi:GAF domain-containing protein